MNGWSVLGLDWEKRRGLNLSYRWKHGRLLITFGRLDNSNSRRPGAENGPSFDRKVAPTLRSEARRLASWIRMRTF